MAADHLDQRFSRGENTRSMELEVCTPPNAAGANEDNEEDERET